MEEYEGRRKKQTQKKSWFEVPLQEGEFGGGGEYKSMNLYENKMIKVGNGNKNVQ